MSKARLSFIADRDGLLFGLEKSGPIGLRKRSVPPSEWTTDMHPGIGLLKLLLDNEAAVIRDDAVQVHHETVACMQRAEADLLGLPQRCPYPLRLEAGGAISDPLFRMDCRWLNRQGEPQHGLKRTGVIVANSVERFIVTEPLFSLLEEIDALNGIDGDGLVGAVDARMKQFERVKTALGAATGDALADPYLQKLTIHSATGFGIEQSGGANAPFEPVLFGDGQDLLGSGDYEEVDIERRPLLPKEHAVKFRTVLFPRQGARSHYRLKDGVYVVVDAPVAAGLKVVDEVNRADAATKAKFKADPRSFLLQAIEEAGGNGDVVCDGSVIRAPMEYGERVLGVRAWDGKPVSFEMPVYHSWFPEEGKDVETLTIPIPGAPQPLVVKKADVHRLIDEIEAASAKKQTTFTFEGKTYPLTPEIQRDAMALAGHVTPPKDLTGHAKEKDAGPSTLMVLRAAENEEDLTFNARLRDPRGSLSRSEPGSDLLTTPQPHQVDAISWLRTAFLSGMPGVLLADDMGLGKTLSVLAFLRWIRTYEDVERRPTLIVAPKKLLENWLDEVAKHIGPEGLGIPLLAYDEGLGRLKVSGSKLAELGQQVLDVDALAAADWVLTTYETLRDYHASFARVRFRVAVYDEAQKMKNLVSLINNAAKCQQPDFTVLMTGTPIENSVMDLWTLLDVAWPGYLGMSGKEFAKTYGKDPSAEQMTDLKSRLIDPARLGTHASSPLPPLMMRRFKSAVLTGLPEKREKKWPIQMPPEQSLAYDAVLSDQRSRQMPALEALQALRSVAFHPDLRMPKTHGDHERIIAASARFQGLFKVLDEASKADERVLIFLELHKAQTILAEMIRYRYRLKEHPKIINGDTSTKALRVIKSTFQEGRGFDVLLLGPRSAGFGLTLTAANHVVHLNRWWNPAVEDQCSDRTYRLGQDKPVTIHLPLAVHPGYGDGSFDVVLEKMLTGKRLLSSEIVVPTTMTQEDFRAMFDALAGEASDAGSKVRPNVDLMGWKEFEEWTATQFAQAGYQPNMTPRTRDKGADIILRAPSGAGNRPIICQCKHRALGEGNVDEEAVEDVLRARLAYGMVYPWLTNPRLLAVTNGRFTLRAAALAREQEVVLVDGARIDGLAGIARGLASQP